MLNVKQKKRSPIISIKNIEINTIKMKNISSMLLIILSFVGTVFAQDHLQEIEQWELSLKDEGTIESIYFKKNNHEVSFVDNEFSGPSWYIQLKDKTVKPSFISFENLKRKSTLDFLDLSIEYKNDHGKLLLIATVKNTGNTPLQPTKLGLRIGIDTYMEKYPDWNGKLFPTLLRCEPTHFWGYFMSPTGKILTISSPDAIASWSHEYSKSGWGPAPHTFEGHRVTSVNLDLINRLPLPSRHPQNLWQLKPGESKAFRIYLESVTHLEEVIPTVVKLTKAPIIELPITSFEKDREVYFSVNSFSHSLVTVSAPSGAKTILKAISINGNKTNYSFKNSEEEGLYQLKVKAENGKIAEANFYIRKPYSYYMQKAMKAVVDYPQKASKSHCESWYGFYTSFTGGKYFPDNKNLQIADNQFKKIYPAVFDTLKFEPREIKHRIQNVSSMIGILVDRYDLYKDKNDLQHAIKLSEYLMQAQTSDGAYRAGKTHYTSVIYIAKSLMELLEVIEPLKKETDYKKSYNTIYASVKLAMDELALNRSNIQTEGQQTFEDGMISCSALQLGAFALLQTNSKERNKYQGAALDMLQQHDCLEQLLIPDARMRSATLRFWEAQYDVMMANNFLNSPHGWSSWTTYANYYAYLLSGDIEYLIKTFNGLNAAIQMIDIKSGKLHWAFMTNPFLEVTQINKNIDGATPLKYPGVHYHAKAHPNSNFIMGEQYVDMVSDWFFANANDNDVHEHFKCLEEVALSKAYVAQKSNGEFIAFNCTVSLKGNTIVVTPNEHIIDKIHINLFRKSSVEVNFYTKTVSKKVGIGMHWITKNE